MNKIFKVIFNHTTQSWTAVSELAKGYSKPSSTSSFSEAKKKTSNKSSSIKTIAITSTIMMAVVPNAFSISSSPGGDSGTIVYKDKESTGIAGGDVWGDKNAIAREGQ
ncbi:hypothetical protein BKK56_02215 [Rodentibacter genomosp. 2]|uniref:ESPR domain-containing protein n=1 Tax=Rodentibacter genomosp. 2 TaxID=1908266 RepID=UPI0009867914|nr:hypothetical protein BKK56_02215 [Rodentibacter genomosp. 2]